MGALPVAVAPRRRDPLWTRIGAMVMSGIVLAPVAAALGREDRTLQGQPTGGAIAIVQPVGEPSSAAVGEPSAATTLVEAAPTSVEIARGLTDAAAPTSAVASIDASIDQPAQVVQPQQADADRVDACSTTYEVRAGDYWLGIADRAGVSAYELATANGATLSSPIYPGDVLCLPPGARFPVPPPPTAPPTTAPLQPAPPSSATSSPTTTRPTATTSAPPTTTGRDPRSYGADEVKDIIRFIFPDDQEDRAIEIAWRESNWKPWAYNGHCCYGLFQIYWSVHRGWLASLGIDSSADLLDPWLNTQAAYVLFQRSGNSWGPWGG